MKKKELSNLVEELVFHQCRHTWITDLEFKKKGYDTTKMCTGCKRSSLTITHAGLPDVGNGTKPYAENTDVALAALQKMMSMYGCKSRITPARDTVVCSITQTDWETGKIIARADTLAEAVCMAMLHYVTGESYA